MIEVKDTYAQVALARHYYGQPIVHNNLIAEECLCERLKPRVSGTFARDEGRICSQCGGGDFIRTGTCHTCATCGNSDGCG